MEEYTKQLMLFKEISGKKVEVDFDGGEVSSDAGVLFLRETESDIGIINKVTGAIVDNRHPSYVKHEVVDLLTQRVFQISSGYEDAKILMIVIFGYGQPNNIIFLFSKPNWIN